MIHATIYEPSDVLVNFNGNMLELCIYAGGRTCKAEVLNDACIYDINHPYIRRIVQNFLLMINDNIAFHQDDPLPSLPEDIDRALDCKLEECPSMLNYGGIAARIAQLRLARGWD